MLLAIATVVFVGLAVALRVPEAKNFLGQSGLHPFDVVDPLYNQTMSIGAAAMRSAKRSRKTAEG